MKNVYYAWLIVCCCCVTSLLAQPVPKIVQPNLPPHPVRMMGEWEEAEALVIAWRNNYSQILSEIVRYASEECVVYILSTDPLQTQLQLAQANVSTDNVLFLPVSYNSVWIRDYGPWTVYENKVGERGISDYRYNRLQRIQDDQVPYEIADYVGTPLFNADENPYQWIHSGGNFLRDGMGTAYSSDLVLRENSGTPGRQIKNWAQLFFGVNDYRILHRLQYDTIHHLDMHIRTLDEETLAVGLYPEGVADGPIIEANLRRLTNEYRTPYGKPYHIMRLPMPDHNGQYPPAGDYRTYTNSVFINKHILVPIYDSPYDEEALQTYRDYFPGYQVEGINCNDIIDELGALHCITKLIGVDAPLWIAHPRLRDHYAQEGSPQIIADIYHESGIAEASVHYRLAGETDYLSIPLQVDSDANSRFTATLPAWPAGTEIEYYLAATANNGKQQVRPLPAPEGFYRFRILNYTAPPTAAWLQNRREVAPGSQVLFSNVSKNGHTEAAWLFMGGEPLIANTDEVLVTYPEAGEYTVRLSVANPLGQDTLVQTQQLRVREAYPPFNASFEQGIDTAWEVINPHPNDGVQWQWIAEDNCEGAYLEVAHRQAPQKLNREYLRTAIDLSGHTMPWLEFRVAYAQRDPFHFDELRVNLVDQQGKSHNLYNRGGPVLATQVEAVPDWQPVSCEDWRTESVDLSDWAGQQFLLEFESIGDRGNSIYLDEIEVRANALPVANIAFPASDTLLVDPLGGPLNLFGRVAAEDTDGLIEQVDFFLNDNYLGTDTEGPYEVAFTLPEWGNYYLQARAYDDEGAFVWTERRYLRYDFTDNTFTPSPLPVNVALTPNPAREQVNLRIDSPEQLKMVDFRLYNTEGRLLRQWYGTIPRGQSEQNIALDALPPAQYWVRVRSGAREVAVAVIKVE